MRLERRPLSEAWRQLARVIGLTPLERSPLEEDFGDEGSLRGVTEDPSRTKTLTVTTKKNKDHKKMHKDYKKAYGAGYPKSTPRDHSKLLSHL